MDIALRFGRTWCRLVIPGAVIQGQLALDMLFSNSRQLPFRLAVVTAYDGGYAVYWMYTLWT
jgi:hypothetical protein